LDKILKKDDFYGFNLALEMGPHDTIPTGIGGDFRAFTAPNGTFILSDITLAFTLLTCH
jgi:hypothetical protein